jgi:hypothetical protein
MLEEKFMMEDNEEMELVKYLLNQADNFIEAVICGSMEASRRCATMFEIDEQGRMSDASPLEMLRNIKDGMKYLVVEVQPEEDPAREGITLLIEDPENYTHKIVVSNKGHDIQIIKLREEGEDIIEEANISTIHKENTVSISVNNKIINSMGEIEALMGVLSSIKSYLDYKEGYRWVVDFRNALAPEVRELMGNTDELIARLRSEYQELQDDIGISSGKDRKGMLS